MFKNKREAMRESHHKKSNDLCYTELKLTLQREVKKSPDKN